MGLTALLIAVRDNNEKIARLLTERTYCKLLLRYALKYAQKEKRYTIVSMLMKVNICMQYLFVYYHLLSVIIACLMTLFFTKHLKWLSRRGFLMFLATQSYLPAAPPPLADSMPR